MFNVKVFDPALKNDGGENNLPFSAAIALAIDGMSIGTEVTITPVEETEG